MATITIEDATVTRIIQGYGFEVKETVTTFSGEKIDVYYTIWNKEERVAVGDRVKAQGNHVLKTETFTGSDNIPKTKTKVNVNDAQVRVLATGDAPF
jgi:hypothetical protein